MLLPNVVIMASVAAMGHVYAMITTMELTAQVNQYFCYFIVLKTSFKYIQNLNLMQHFFIFDSCM